MGRKNIFDAIVIGNGAIGCALSIELGVTHRVKTAIIGKNSRKLSGSTAAGAMTNCYAEITEETFMFPHNEKFKIAKAGLASWEKWIKFIKNNTESNIHYGKGTYLILNSFGGNLDRINFNLIEDYILKNEIKHSLVDVTSLPLNPVDQSKPLKSIYLFDEGYVNPNDLFHAYDSIINKTEMITSFNNSVRCFNEENGCYKVTFTDNTVIYGNKLVLAAGFFNNEFIKQLREMDQTIPQFASVGCSLNIFAEDHGINNVIRTPSRGGGCGFNLVPRDNNHLYFGATASLSLNEVQHPSLYYINNLIRALTNQFDRKLLYSKITDFLVGHRPFTLDKLPMVGCLTNPNLWVVSGFNRDGFHCAPFIAQEVASDLFSNKAPTHPLFSPLRRPYFIRSVDESINNFCDAHYYSALSEMEPKLQSTHDDYILGGVRKDITAIYDDLGISFGLDPEILWMLLRLYKNKDIGFTKFKSIIRKYEVTNFYA